MLAYRSGIFPMADHRDDPEVFWVEPRRRAILPLDGFHLSRSLARRLRQGRFAVSCNAAFAEVMENCAAPRQTDGGDSWISRRIAASYQQLHRLGHAHSIEVWRDGALVGGLYGVGFDRAFCGESMFSRAADASKVALAWLVAGLRRGGAELLDCQFMTAHLASLGAIEISQSRYLGLLRQAQRDQSSAAGAAAGGEGGDMGEAVGDGAGVGEGVGDGEGEALPLPAAFGALLADSDARALSSSPGKLIAQLLTQTS